MYPCLPSVSVAMNQQYFTLPGLFHVESMEWLMDSMEFPDGFHTVFRVESMES